MEIEQPTWRTHVYDTYATLAVVIYLLTSFVIVRLK